MEKKSFILFCEIKEVISELSNEQKGILFQGIVDYANGIEPHFEDVAAKIAFIPIKQDIDRNAEKWEQRKQKRSEAGKKGMEKRWGKNNTDNNAVTEDNTVITNDNNVITENNKHNTVTEFKEKTKRFTPPTVEDVREYCFERGNGVNAEQFVDFYSSKGWCVGKNKMKDWKACVRTWEQRDNRRTAPMAQTDNINNYLMQQATGGI